MNLNSKKCFYFACLFWVVIFILPQVSFCELAEITVKKKIASPSDTAEYTIGSGDVLDITTWKEADFSREELFVRIDGKITFPLLGDIQAAGRTPQQLKISIEKQLATYVGSPVVTVNVRVPGSQKFYVLGEVVRTGEYNLVKHLTIIQAFALAGGFTEWASKDEIILFRVEDGKEKIIRVDYKSILKGENFENNILIKANDTIIVP
ncbi:MAG: sugar ABC transporter substrate-binding protein [Desulfobacterium sp.]|nr:sugar ABC transporter substrate-binding protein [Desulfobacterium sp.]